MQTKEINIEALDAVLTAVLGEEGSRAVATAYEFTDNIMFKAHMDGFDEGWAAGYEHGKDIGRADQVMDDKTYEVVECEAFDDEVEPMRVNAVPARFAGQAGFQLYDFVRQYLLDEGLVPNANEAVDEANHFWARWTDQPFIARD
jgi:hypothetical protein